MLQRAGIILVALAGTLAGQVPAGARRAAPESAVVVPGAVYRVGAVGRLLYGDHYRDLWTAPLTVPVLSLAEYAGGLRPLARGGSQQTRSLRFRGADGHEYVFRSVDKDPSPSLPAEVRGTYASRVVRDLISAQHPGGALVVARLLDAAGVLHATPELTVMPDDPALGEFRGEFAGMLGLIEVRPTDDPDDEGGSGFAGATKVVSSEKLLERITASADERVDARAFLAARLFDMFVGDWDRHPDQWRWARFGNAPDDRWQPIPRDRDWALVKLDGVVWSLARLVYPYPQFVSFGREYPDPLWLTWNGRVLDRRILAELERSVWDSVATALRERIPDSVIDDAIRRLPPSLAAASGDFLRRALISRRERLAEAAGRFYRQLVEDAEVHGTDGSEIVEVTRVGKRFTDLTVRRPSESGEPRSSVVSVRRFDAAETREIRVYLHGGNDRVVVRGHATGRTIVRVIAGAGRTTFADSTAGGGAERIRYYAESAASAAEPGTRARIDRRPYVAPQTSRGWIDPPRDWGTRRSWAPWASYSPDAGLFLGGGPTFERYGFRQHPYAARMSLLAGYAAGVNRWRAEFTADLRREGSAMHATVVARASELDILHFHGFGNETSAPGPKAFHRVEQRAFGVEPMLHVPLARHLTLGLGATARHATTGPDSGRFIAATRPFGVGSFGQIGARARLTFDSRDTPAFATRGVFATLLGAQYPGIWSAEGPFGAVRAQAATYLSAPLRLRPVLALRVGGDRVWGEYPFFDAAFLGGASTLRGWREERFAGDASLYGNAELRVVLAKVSLLLPADLGAFGLADGGRVFISGERSDAWHTAFGGGLWVSFLGRANTFSIAAARGREGTGIYFRTGMLF